VRNEEAVNRHLRLSCLAQSILQRTPTIASKHIGISSAV
jgi:hypothetical protein